ncbi:MAG: hypothetical protein IPM66_00905 [Acidobacteriota bacterium]|nr:MAG: hypothetical protein IPM66_00905 [Acidobacteriota bacterium]
MSFRKTLELFTGIATITIALTAQAWAQSSISSRASENERNRAYAREQFTKNFRDIQLNGQKLLKDHRNRALTPRELARHAREINKNAKKLRSLMALGDLAEKVEIEKDVDTPEEFDKSIRRLAKLIWDFAHNSIHKNSKVFNTDLAARAQTDLLTIIDLSKILSDVARDYVQNVSIEE